MTAQGAAPYHRDVRSRSPFLVGRAAVGGRAPDRTARAADGWRAWTNPLDLAIAGVVATWATIEAVLIPSTTLATQIAFALTISLPLAFRRRLPITVLLIVAAALVVHASFAGPDATFNPFPSLLIATFTVGERVAPWWRAAIVGAVPVAAMLTANAFGYFGAGVDIAGTVLLVFFVGATWAAGRIVRYRAQAVDEARERSAQLAQDAVATERERIARELHDIVAHALSIVTLQAAAAQRFLPKDLDRAGEHLELTRRTAQQALGEMRNLLGVLREEPALYRPQPGITQLPELVAETEAFGHACSLEVDPSLEALSDGHALAVYRVVQESLTNVRKHAPGAEIAVAVRRRGSTVDTAVENGRPNPVASDREPLAGSGQGLPGMAERARVYGGTLEAGPRPGGGWLVRMSFPLVAGA
jgi:signal transduction histidine kinase